MQEINYARQESSAQSSENKKLFEISWTELECCRAVVRAKNRKEALDLFHHCYDQVWDNIEYGHREQFGEPRIKEVRA